jgi:polysaccharide export outer membrane protein
VIEPGDVLSFRAFGAEELTRPALNVRYDGQVSLPFIPDVLVQDLTREQAEARLRDAYAEVLVDPQISLTILEAASKSYHVMGDVSRPGEYPYRQKTSVLDAINQAGGQRINRNAGDSIVGESGQLTRAYVIRHSDDRRRVLELDLRNLRDPGPHAADTPVFPGDVVYVPEGINLVYLMGEVGGARVYEVTPGLTVLQLMARAGGPRMSTARLHEVVLMRQIDPERTRVAILDVARMLNTGQDVTVQAGDIIYVPRKRLVIIQEFIGRFTGTVSPLMNLYQNAWRTYYTDDQFRRLYEDDGNTNDTLAFIDSLRTATGLINSVSGVVP